MLLQDLRRLTIAGTTRVDNRRAHRLQDRHGALERRFRTADHEGERGGGGAANSARGEKARSETTGSATT
jgi:hypothetical protein